MPDTPNYSNQYSPKSGENQQYPSLSQQEKGRGNLLLAPNGQPSNLSPALYAYVRTPEFKQWFGDWQNNPKNASRILDENGEPLVLYRGQWSHANVPFVNHGDGIYFTPNRKAAIGYGMDHNPIPVFLNARNPYEVDFDGDSDTEENDYHTNIKDEYHYAREENFDILIATNTFDGENDLDQYVVHDNSQIQRIDTLNPKDIISNVLKEDLLQRNISVDNDILRNYYGLSHLVVSKNKNIVSLNEIIVAKQNEGKGSQFMREFIDLADNNGWTLALTPDTSLGATSAHRLRNFYRRFGFVNNKGSHADLNIKERMVRPTKKNINIPQYTNTNLNYATKRPKTFGAPYQGSKNRIADKIIMALPKGKRFVDLFSGGGAVAHAALLSDRFETIQVNDRFPAGQQLFIQGIKGEWKNKRLKPISEDDFKKIIGTPEAIVRSVRAKGKTLTKPNNGRDRAQEQLRRVKRLEQLRPYESKLQSSELDYSMVKLNKDDVVYCDIPYENTRQDGYTGKFDKQRFINWAQQQDVPVYVSEYEMPEGWTEIASFNVAENQIKDKQEKLFVQDKFAEQYFTAKAEEYNDYMTNKTKKMQFQFIGESGAQQLDKTNHSLDVLLNLATAKEMTDAGSDPLTIKMATGWEMGIDKKWRYEIPDFMMPESSLSLLRDSFTDGKPVTLNELMPKAIFLDAYPELAQMPVIIDNSRMGGAAYDPENKVIKIAATELYVYDVNDLNAMNVADTLLHETQHVIQHIEGFATGTSALAIAEQHRQEAEKEMAELSDIYHQYQILAFKTQTNDPHEALLAYNELDNFERQHQTELRSYLLASERMQAAEMEIVSKRLSDDNYQKYLAVAGEVEARNVVNRSEMTPEERRRTLAAATEDVARESQTIIFNGLSNLLRNTGTPLLHNDIILRDKLITLMRNAGINVNTNWQEGQTILDAANSQIKLMSKRETKNKKTTTSERSGAVAGNSSSDSLNFDTKERLSRHPFGVQNLDAKILQNTEITKSRIKKIINQGDFSVKSQNPSEITRHINKRLRLDKSKSSQSYYGDYYEGDFNIGEERTVRVRLSTHPATGERLGNAPTDDKISLVVYKNGEHHTTGQGYGEYSEWIYDPQKMSGEQIARQIINGIDNLLNNGEYIDPTISPVIYPSTETAQIIAQAQANGTYLKAPNGEDTTLQQKQWAQVRTDAFKNWFGDWQNGVIFTANNVDDIIALKVKYPSTLPNKYYHHSTNKYGKQTFDPREGKKERLHIIGRLTTEKVDCLLVENPNSNNKYPHITLATAKGIKPFESNTEIAKHQDMIQPLDDYVDTTFRNNISRDVSKLIDKNGEPMVLYHGTNTEFYTFKQKEGVRYTIGIPIDVKSQGFFLTDDKDLAEDFARSRYRQNNEEGKPQVMDAYVSMKKPADLSELTNESEELFYKIAEFWPAVTMGYETIDKWWQIADDEEIDIDARLKELGYDGIIFAEEIDEDGKTVAKSYFVTNPNQIKSATLNNGEFSLENNDIRFQLANSSSLSPQATAVSEHPSQQPIFISNALLALQKIKQERATPGQWLAMLQKQGGIKQGEDRWTGLSEWLSNNTEKSLNKQQLLDFIAENQIRIEETHYMELEESPQFKDLYEEFLKHIDEVHQLYEQANQNVAEFLNEMQNKYGINCDYEQDLTPQELEEWNNLLDERDYYDTNIKSAEDSAFGLMVNIYGKTFDEAFANERGELYIYDSEKATEFFDNKIKDIEETRLGYTTHSLDNKREIALTVPTIDSYNADDIIHFGDADDGRAIAWARFGETTMPHKDTEDEINVKISKLPKPDEWEKMDGSNFVNKHDCYFFPDTKNLPGHSYISKDDQGLFHIEGPMAKRILVDKSLHNQFDSLNEAVNTFNKLWVTSKQNTTYDKILVIDEIQSKRHQDGREQGYRSSADTTPATLKDLNIDRSGVIAKVSLRGETFYFAKSMSDENILSTINERKADGQLGNQNALVPDAPFEHNWHELAMKRMLRYAAENGYDRVAWTTGEQQAERYDLSKMINFISYNKDSHKLLAGTLVEGSIDYNQYNIDETVEPEELPKFIGKDLAPKVLEKGVLQGVDLRVGGEGMKAFYDNILVKFTDKYTKKWGAKTEDVELPEIGETMHSVPVTEQMRSDVMQGQPMFFLTPQGDAYGFTKDNNIFIDTRIATSETPIHEYAHLWAAAMRQYNTNEWNNIVNLMKQVQPVWEMVQSQYKHLTTDSDIAEEVLAQYSGKQGMRRLEKALKNFDNNLTDNQAQSILSRIKEAIDRFWQKTADFLHIHYQSADQVADRVMYDLLNQVNPQTIAQQTGQKSQTFQPMAPMASIYTTDSMPTILAYSTASYSEIQSLAHEVKNGDTEAIKKAAGHIADMINVIPDKDNFLIIPMPSHNGKATYTKTLAEEVAKLTGLPSTDILTCQPHTPLYDYKKVNGIHNIPTPSFSIKESLPQDKIPLIIDNVLDTGTTAYAAAQAFGTSSNARIAVLGNTDNFYLFHNGIILESKNNLYANKEQNQKVTDKQPINLDEVDRQGNNKINFQLTGQQGTTLLDTIDQKGRIENQQGAQDTILRPIPINVQSVTVSQQQQQTEQKVDTKQTQNSQSPQSAHDTHKNKDTLSKEHTKLSPSNSSNCQTLKILNDMIDNEKSNPKTTLQNLKDRVMNLFQNKEMTTETKVQDRNIHNQSRLKNSDNQTLEKYNNDMGGLKSNSKITLPSLEKRILDLLQNKGVKGESWEENPAIFLDPKDWMSVKLKDETEITVKGISKINWGPYDDNFTYASVIIDYIPHNNIFDITANQIKADDLQRLVQHIENVQNRFIDSKERALQSLNESVNDAGGKLWIEFNERPYVSYSPRAQEGNIIKGIDFDKDKNLIIHAYHLGGYNNQSGNIKINLNKDSQYLYSDEMIQLAMIFGTQKQIVLNQHKTNKDSEKNEAKTQTLSQKTSPQEVFNIWQKNANDDRITIVQRQTEKGFFYTAFGNDAEKIAQILKRETKPAYLKENPDIRFISFRQDAAEKLLTTLLRQGGKVKSVDMTGKYTPVFSQRTQISENKMIPKSPPKQDEQQEIKRQGFKR